MKTIIRKYFLKECKYNEKEENVIRHITDDLGNSYDSDEYDKDFFFQYTLYNLFKSFSVNPLYFFAVLVREKSLPIE